MLAVQLLNVNQLLCPESVSDWHSATFSTVRERESRPQQVVQWTNWATRITFANVTAGFPARRKQNHSESECCRSLSDTCRSFAVNESRVTFAQASTTVPPRPHAGCVVRRRFTSESRQFHSRPACSRLSSTELRMERISSWSDSIQFVHSKHSFVRPTRSRPTQH